MAALKSEKHFYSLQQYLMLWKMTVGIWSICDVWLKHEKTKPLSFKQSQD